jgi:RNA polymerase sigma factor (sigma-70 family)
MNAVTEYLRRLLGEQHTLESDSALLCRFVHEADEAAFASIMKLHGPLVFGICKRVLGHEQDAEDAFQASFLVLARKAKSIREQAALSSWLYGTAYRLCVRAKARSVSRSQRERQSSRPAQSGPHDDVTWNELRSVLDEELARLSDRHRAPLLLCYFKGLNQDQAARQLGCRVRTLKARLKRGRELLRRRLARRGLTLSAALAVPLLTCEVTAAGFRPGLIQTTAHAARLFATHQPMRNAVAKSVVNLAQGNLRAIILSKCQIALALMLTVTVAVGGTTLALDRPPSLPQEKKEAAPRVKQELPRLVDGLQFKATTSELPSGALARLGTNNFRFRHEETQRVSFLQDGKTILTASGSKVLMWETTTGRQIRSIDVSPIAIRGYALSPDCSLLGVGGGLTDDPNWENGVIRVLDTATGKEIRSFARTARDMSYCALAFTPDNKCLISCGDTGKLLIEEISSGSKIRERVFPRDRGSIALSPDGSLLAVYTGANTQKTFLWKWQTEEKPSEIPIGTRRISGLSFSPDGRLLAACSDLKEPLAIWDVGNAKIKFKLPAPLPFNSCGDPAFSPDSRLVVVASHEELDTNRSGGIFLWSLVTGTIIKGFPIPGETARATAISADGRWLVALCHDRVHVWDMQTGAEIGAEQPGHSGAIEQVATSATVIATASNDHTVRLWDSLTYKPVGKLQHDACVRAIAFSPDGTWLASSCLDDVLRIWDVTGRREIRKFPGHGKVGGCRVLSFSADGSRLLSWGDDDFVRVWDVINGQLLLAHDLRIPDPEEPDKKDRVVDATRDMAVFSRDGACFVISSDGQHSVYDTLSGKKLRTILAPDCNRITSLTLSSDSKYLLASSFDKSVETKLADGRTRFSVSHTTVSLWELETGKLIRSQKFAVSYRGPSAIFSPDSKQIVVKDAKPGARIHFYDLKTGQEQRVIEGMTGDITAFCITPDNKRLICALNDTTALVWNLSAMPDGK